jgi:uncharacterized protein
MAETGTEARPWRETVREAARAAAQAEEERAQGEYPGLYDYRWEHVQAVVRVAARLAEQAGADREVVEAAAWLHDVAKGKGRRGHGAEGAIEARRILAKTDYPAHKVEAVADAIAKHVGLSRDEPDAPLEPIEAAVIWDADKLTKLGATTVLHLTGLLFPHERVTSETLLEMWGQASWGEPTVRSFSTAPARKAGRARWEALRAFVRQAREELDGEDILAEQEG